MIRLFAGLVALWSVLAASAAEWVKIDGAEAHPTRVLAKLKPARNIAQLAAAAPDVKVKRSYSQIPRLVVIEPKDPAKLKAAVAGNADEAAALKKTINDLKATGMFEYVVPDHIVYPDLTPTDRRFLDGTLWGLQNSGQFGGVAGADINVTRAWDLAQGDTNLVVAVIDTGVNYNHQDLAAQMWRNPDEIPGNGVDDDNNGIVDDIFGINALLDNGDPLDSDGHGSHVSGTIGAAANNGFEHVGVIWKVRIMGLKFLGPNGGSIADGIQCINYAISKRVLLSNNSWGGGPYNQALFDAIDAARGQGHLFVAAKHPYRSHAIYSDDHGQTWQLGGIEDEKTNESTLVELADGTVLHNMRSYHGQNTRAIATSKDAGQSWSEFALDGALIDPVCQASILRFSWKPSQILFGNCASKKRENLTIRLSRDEGKTWLFSKTLNPGPSAYSCLAAKGETIYCLYERGEKSPYEKITLATFKTSWIAE